LACEVKAKDIAGQPWDHSLKDSQFWFSGPTATGGDPKHWALVLSDCVD